MARSFAKGALMQWNNQKITDHNRSELSVDVERIETVKRMANGTMRKYVIADKHTFTCTWKDLPFESDFAVDGFWAGREIESFYLNNPGPFTLKITHGDNEIETYLVMMTNFGKNISKRGAYDLWQVNVTLEEV